MEVELLQVQACKRWSHPPPPPPHGRGRGRLAGIWKGPACRCSAHCRMLTMLTYIFASKNDAYPVLFVCVIRRGFASDRQNWLKPAQGWWCTGQIDICVSCIPCLPVSQPSMRSQQTWDEVKVIGQLPRPCSRLLPSQLYALFSDHPQAQNWSRMPALYIYIHCFPHFKQENLRIFLLKTDWGELSYHAAQFINVP